MSLSKSLGATTSGVFMAGIGLYVRLSAAQPTQSGEFARRIDGQMEMLGTILMGMGVVLVLVGLIGVFSSYSARSDRF